MAFGFTATAGTITGTHSGFVGLFVTANFPAGSLSGPNAILNGGGNLRAYTDSTKATALPLEIVSLVTGGTPEAQVWVRLNSLSTGGTVYLEADDTETTQPAVTDPLGRNAVWQDQVSEFHFQDSGADSAGNNDLSDVGSPVYVDGNIGRAFAPLGTARLEDTSFGGSTGSNITITCWVNADDMTTSAYVSQGFVGGSNNRTAIIKGYQPGHYNIFDQGAYPTGNPSDTQIPATAGVYSKLTYTTDGTRLKGYMNGLEVFDVAATTTVGLTRLIIGGSLSADTFDGDISNYRVTNRAFDSDLEKLEYDNQSSPSTFWSSSAWVDSGGGISVTEQLKNINYTPLDPTITLTGGIVVAGQLKNISFSSLNPSITLTGVISVTEQLKNIQYQALNPVIDLTGTIDVTEQTVSINYSALNPTITLTPAPIQVTESLVSVQWKSNNPSITLTPSPIEITESLSTINFVARSPSILLTPEPIGIVSTVVFNGVLLDLSFNGDVKNTFFDGSVKNLEFNGSLTDLEFNGTITDKDVNGTIN